MIGAFIIYLVKATICLVVFSLFFRLLLVRETFFRFTRITLIVGLLLCALLPLWKIDITQSGIIQRPIAQFEKMVISYEIPKESKLRESVETKITWDKTETTGVPDEMALISPDEGLKNLMTEKWVATPKEKPMMREKKQFPLLAVAFAIYLSGLMVMIVRLAMSLRRLWLLILNHPAIRCDGYKLIVSEENIVPFSFFHYIVLSKSDWHAHSREIILHEQMHIRYRHNLDILFAELFLLIHWFNPAVWSIYSDLREVHEFEADNAVIEKGIDAREYQLLLVKKAVGERRFTSVVNSFNQSKIKNRITMMLRKESNSWARLKVLLIVPLAAMLLLAFAQPEMVEGKRWDNESWENATDYFLSVQNERKDNYLAYLYLNVENQLYLMDANADITSIKMFNLQEKSDLTKTLTDLMTGAMDKMEATDIRLMMGAENDTKMENVSRLKEVMREAYNKSFERVSRKDKPLIELKKEFPLTITYTSVQPPSPGSIVKQVQENPYFYWEEVQQYCKAKGISPKELEIKPGTEQVKRLFNILVNSKNQVLLQSQVRTEVFKVAEEANSPAAIQTLKKLIVETMDINNPDALYFSLQHDGTSSTQFIFTLLESTLPAAYKAALDEMAERDHIAVDRLRKEKPLLLLYVIPKNVNKEGNFEKKWENLKSDKMILRASAMKDGEEDNIFYSLYRNKENQQLGIFKFLGQRIYDKHGNIREINSGFSYTFEHSFDPVDLALVATGSEIPIGDMDETKDFLNNKLNTKKTIFMMGLPTP